MTPSQIISSIWSVTDLTRDTFMRGNPRNTVLPLTLLRRIDQVLEPTKEKVLTAYGRLEGKPTNPDDLLRKASGYDFYNTSLFTFERLVGDSENLADNLRVYVRSFSPNIREVIERFDFENTIAELDRAEILFRVVEKFAEVDLNPERVSDRMMGMIFEELIRKFNEALTENAGEYLTPWDLVHLMVRLLVEGEDENLGRDRPLVTVHDPCCGTGGLLTMTKNVVERLSTQADVHVFGQDVNQDAVAICKAKLFIKGDESEADNIRYGSTLAVDQHDGRGFDYMVANPPYGQSWKRERDAVEAEAARGFNGRFGAGTPRVSDSQLLFVQHLIHHMKPEGEGGSRIALVTNGSPLSTGDAGSGESEIRRWILENDLLETLVSLPPGALPHTAIKTYLWIITNRKPTHRRGKVQLIDGTEAYSSLRKPIGGKSIELREQDQDAILGLYRDFQDGDFCRILPNAAFGYQKIKIVAPPPTEARPPAIDGSARFHRIPLERSPDDFLSETVHPSSPRARIASCRVGYEIDRIKHLGFGLQREVQALERDYSSCELIPLGQICSITRRTKRPNRGDEVGRIRDLSGLRGIELAPDTSVVLEDFLRMFLTTELGRRMIEAVAETSSLVIHPRDLDQIPIPVPTMEDQQELVRVGRQIGEVVDAAKKVEAELAANPQNLQSVREEMVPVLTALHKLSDADQVRELVRQGESKRVEFKQTFSLDIKDGKKADYLEEACLKTIVAFLNSAGGDLLVGVSDSGELVGLHQETSRFYKGSNDRFLLHVKTKIKQRIGEPFYPLIDQRTVQVDDATVLWVKCGASDEPVFLDEEAFYVRTNPATDRLSGLKQARYIARHFYGSQSGSDEDN